LDDENRMRSMIPGFFPMSSATLTLNGIPETGPMPGPSQTFLQMMAGEAAPGGERVMISYLAEQFCSPF
jgi:hypothetical protein